MVLGMRFYEFQQRSLGAASKYIDRLIGVPSQHRVRWLLAPEGAVERCFKPGDRDRRGPDLAIHGSRQGRVGYVRLASNFPDPVFIGEFDNRRSDGEQALNGLFGATFGGGELSGIRVLGWAIEAGGHEKTLLLSNERRGTRRGGAMMHRLPFGGWFR